MNELRKLLCGFGRSPGGGHDKPLQAPLLAWRIPMDRGAWWDVVHVVTESDTVEQLSTKALYQNHIIDNKK